MHKDMSSLLVRGGRLADVAGLPRADLLLRDGHLAAVGDLSPAAHPGARVLEADGRLIAPGLIDAHSHAAGLVGGEDVQLALLRQGITTVIGGQDGVSYAPGGGRYASTYFAAIDGPRPGGDGPRIADLLAAADGASAVNVAHLVGAGTVRHEIMGPADREPSAGELRAMTGLVAEGIADGAAGVSTGLDYTPGLYAQAEEIAALCRPAAAAGLPYVTHMRGGYEENSEAGIEEVARIAQAAGVAVHISHFHTRAAEAERLLAGLAAEGIEASFDAYPYTRGCSLLGMSLLPPAMNALASDPRARDQVARQLRESAVREQLRRDWFPRVDRNASLGPAWPELITIAHTPAPEFAGAHGLTLAELAARRGGDAVDAALDLLAASRLEVNVVMAVQDQRPVEDLGALISHPRHLGGSDGIFVGAHPHPRARGTFAHYLATYVREHGFLDWSTAIEHLSTGTARLFRLGERGRIAPGAVADLVLIDPETVRDTATYEEPLGLAVGIEDVIVGGRQVLADGRLTGETPGRGLRAGHREHRGAP